VGQIINPSGSFGTRNIVLEKIRAAMAAAQIGNPTELQPWLPPASINTGPANLVRSNLTTYRLGTMFTNAAGTHQFCVRTQAGATAAAEPAGVTNPIVAVNPFGMGDIIDGAQTLAWLGPVRTLAALPGAPSLSSGALPAQLTTEIDFPNAVNGLGAGTFVRFSGGSGAFSGLVTNYLVFIRAFSVPVGGSNQFNGSYAQGSVACFCEFLTDAPYLAMDLTTGAAGGIGVQTVLGDLEIDGRRLFDGQLVTVGALGAPNGFVILDWRSTGLRKIRRIRIYNPTFGRIYIAPSDTISFPTNPNRYRMAIVGDSLWTGGGGVPYIPSWSRPTIFCNLIGCDDVVFLGQGATGYLQNAGGFNYRQRINDVIITNPDVIHVSGSVNDVAFTSQQRITEAIAYFQALRSSLPNAMIIAQGIIGGVNPALNSISETDIKTAVTQFNDSNTFFIPAALDTPAWQTGTGNLNGVTGIGNSDIYVGPADTTHYSQMGTSGYLAQKDAAGFKNLINAIPR